MITWQRIKGRVEARTLAAIGAVACGTWAFVALASSVGRGGPHSIDAAVLDAVTDGSSPIGPRWVEEAMRDLTALGSVSVQALVVLAVAGFLLLARNRRDAVLVSIGGGGGGIVGHLAKLAFDRPRPGIGSALTEVYTSSFPSAHSSAAAATYLTLGVIVASAATGRATKIYAVLCGAILAVITGLTRVYFGVHWASDVVAGWALGAGWALACWTIAQLVRARMRPSGEVRTEPERARVHDALSSDGASASSAGS